MTCANPHRARLRPASHCARRAAPHCCSPWSRTTPPIPDPTRATMPYGEAVKARTHAAEQAVAAALTSVPKGLSATGEVRDGDTAGQLLEVAGTVDLLVLGSHGRGLVGRLIMGSTSDVVVRGAACPVLVVPPNTKAKDAQPESHTLAHA
jgi:nucleotide-binding universal stress UspA family protein